MITDREEIKRLVAYKFWQDDGRPHGKDVEHWQRAEAELTRFDTTNILECATDHYHKTFDALYGTWKSRSTVFLILLGVVTFSMHYLVSMRKILR